MVKGYFTAVWTNGLTVSATATFKNGTTATDHFVLNITDPSLETFNWHNVESVRFVTSGGNTGAWGENFALNNLTIAAVSEPEEWAMMLLGIPLLVWTAGSKARAGQQLAMA